VCAPNTTENPPGDTEGRLCFGILRSVRPLREKHLAEPRLELFTLKNRRPFAKSFRAQCFTGILIALATLGLSSCGQQFYRFPQYTFAGRPIPPSQLANRVMVSVSANGSSGNLQILDALRDIRNNVQDTIRQFSISGYASGLPTLILNFPEQVRGYVYSDSDGSLSTINYSTESSSGPAGTLGARSTSVAVPTSFANTYSAQQTASRLVVLDNTTSRTYALNLPNVYRVAVNQGNTVVLAMVQNSNTLYRLVKLNSNQPSPPGAVDCQPYNLPVYCVVPVPGTYDRPIGAYFSLDGASAYILNCGQECGGTTSGVTLIQQAPLNTNVIPASLPYPSPQVTTVPVPGGATVAVSDGSTLYLAGQQLQPDGLFAGFLSTYSLASNVITGQYSISDGNHTRLLFADDNTLWVGSQFCATGERAKRFAAGDTSQAANYNCLTRFDLGAKAASIVPAVSQSASGPVNVPYPNENGNLFYYGDLTGLCWVQNLHKVYTAYGGQVHAFNTADGSEINNYNITVQGTALDVAYMDALTNAAD